jgi:hypothetical protein
LATLLSKQAVKVQRRIAEEKVAVVVIRVA